MESEIEIPEPPKIKKKRAWWKSEPIAEAEVDLLEINVRPPEKKIISDSDKEIREALDNIQEQNNIIIPLLQQNAELLRQTQQNGSKKPEKVSTSVVGHRLSNGYDRYEINIPQYIVREMELRKGAILEFHLTPDKNECNLKVIKKLKKVE